MLYKVSTTGTLSQIPLDDMGERILIHPTVAIDLGLEYTDDELLDSNDLQDAIDNGYLTVIEKSVYPPLKSGDVSYYIDTDTVVTDSYTSISGTFIPMQSLVHRRDLYNDSDNPLYVEGFTPILGVSGSLTAAQNDISTINTALSNTGWYTRNIRSWDYPAPQDLLIYYGWLNSFNSATNSWNNELVAQEMAEYNYLVFGDGIQDPSHGDYSNTEVIVPRVKNLSQTAQIFGYVTANQTLANFKTKVDQWETLEVDGIFIDEAGYDYGTTRSGLNERIDYVHGKTYANICFANSWNADHVLGTVNDPSYPNSTYNPNEDASNLNSYDWYLLESFPINTTSYTSTGGYESKSDWSSRGNKAASYRYNMDINLAAVGIINNSNTNGQDLFNFGFVSSLMWAVGAWGTSDTSYGSSSAAVTKWDRPSTDGLGRKWAESPSVQVDTGDSDVYYRYLDFGRLKLDFSSSDQESKITTFTSMADKVIEFGPACLLDGASPSPALTTFSGVTVVGLSFDDTTDETMYGAFDIPDNWREDSDIEVKVKFFNISTQSGDKVCRWKLEYQIYDSGDSLSSPSTSSTSVNCTLSTNQALKTYTEVDLTVDQDDTNNPVGRGKTFSFIISREASHASDTMIDDAVMVLLIFYVPVEKI